MLYNRAGVVDIPKQTEDVAEHRHRFMGPQECWLAGLVLILLGVVGGVYVENLVGADMGPEHQALGSALYCCQLANSRTGRLRVGPGEL